MAAGRRVQSHPSPQKFLLVPLDPHPTLPPSPVPTGEGTTLSPQWINGGLVKTFNFQAQNRANSLYTVLIRFTAGLAAPGVRANSG
jgi:hypothetical protein